MKLSGGNLYWPTTCSRNIPARPLQQSVSCDVLVVGAGITGAMAACHLARAGRSVIVVDRRTIAAGSTSASTAMVMSELDVPLSRLSTLIEKDRASLAYRASHQAVEDLASLIETLDDACEFSLRRSLLLASRTDDEGMLREELEARALVGIGGEFINGSTLRAVFGIHRQGAVLGDHAAEVNPVRLTRALFRDAESRGARIYDCTEIELPPGNDEPHVARTADGHTITYSAMVIATGYETPDMFAAVQALTTLKSTYALASVPISATPWPGSVLIWETAHPYSYLRSAPGGRVIVGGEDNALIDPSARDAHIEVNTKRLVRKAADIVEGLNITPDFAWAGTFAETEDSLPLIGTVERWPGVYFALGYGGNGITFSLIAAQIIRDALTDQANENSRVFSFERALQRNRL